MREINPAVVILAALMIVGPTVADTRVRADPVGTTVRDVHGRLVGTVRDIEYDHEGDVLNVVITLGALPGGGERYVILPWHHLDASGGKLRFKGARERLVDAPRRADEPAR